MSTCFSPDFTWVHEEPDFENGNYCFDGEVIVTPNVKALFTSQEIQDLVDDIQHYAKTYQGIFWWQVYINKRNQKKVFLLDNLSKQDKQDLRQEWVKIVNYFTILMPDEFLKHHKRCFLEKKKTPNQNMYQYNYSF